jgi:hypothetical protein
MAIELSAAAQLEKGCLAYTFSRVEGTDDGKIRKRLFPNNDLSTIATVDRRAVFVFAYTLFVSESAS